MGAFSGSMTFSTFLVRGELPRDFRMRFLEGIRRDAFRPLVPEEETDESVGWCSIQHPFDLDLTLDKVLFNSYLNLGLRSDRWRIPASLFKAHFTERERDVLASKDRDRLTKREKAELKAAVTSTLRRQILPAMKVVDLCWNLDTGVVRFWSQAKGLVETLHELFTETFGLSLVQHSPFVLARSSGIDDDSIALLTTLEPTPFHALVLEDRADDQEE